MKDFIFFIFFTNSVVFSVYVRDELPSTKSPLQVEELPWLAFFDRKPSSDIFARNSQVQRKNVDLVSHSTLCPPGETGQFPYPPDCKRFINCWKGRGSIQVCAPGTLFNSETFECDFPGKVKCAETFDNVPLPTGERYVRFPHERPPILHNQRVARKNQNEQTKPDSIPAKPYPGRPPYFGASHLQPPTRPSNQTQGREVRPQCMLGATGLYPHPYDCSKFLKCWSGNTFIQNCGPGTFFNPLISACDHPRNVPCAHEGNYQTVQPDDDEIQTIDLHVPEESVQYEQYQSPHSGVKGGKKTTKPDPESPNYDDNPQVSYSTPKSEVEDLEGTEPSDSEASHRKPKVINIGSKKNQYVKGHGKEPASYLTPPQYDVYGNVIGSNDSKQANLGVQPGQSGYPNNPKTQAENPSSYPSNPYLINYPPQGPYSTLQPESQKKVSSLGSTKNYYGYMLKPKPHPAHPQHPTHPHHQHPVHPQHPGHPHHHVHPSHPNHPHTGPPTWLVPPPMQPQFFPHYAPYHPFSPKSDSNTPQSSYNPYFTSDGKLCSNPKSEKHEPSAPICEPDSSFYEPSVFPQPPQKEQTNDFKPQFHPTPVKPSSDNHQKSDYTPQVQIDLNPKRPTNAFYPPTDSHTSYSPQQSKPKENPHQPTSSHPQQPGNADSNKQTSQQTPQYLPYLFYYYPFNSNLYPYYMGGYYPYQNFNSQTFPNYPQLSPNAPNQQHNPFNPPNQSQTPYNPTSQQPTSYKPTNQQQTPYYPSNQPQTPYNPTNQQQTPHSPTNQQQTPYYPSNQPQTPYNPTNQQQTPHSPTNQQQTPYYPSNQPQTPYNPTNQQQTPHSPTTQQQTPYYPSNQPQNSYNTPNHPQSHPNTPTFIQSYPNYPNQPQTPPNTPSQSQPNTPTYTHTYPYSPDHPQTPPNTPNKPDHPQLTPNTPTSNQNYPQSPTNTPTYYPSYPQPSQPDSHPGQSTISDPFSTVTPQYKPNHPEDTNPGSLGPVEVSDPHDDTNPNSYPISDKNRPLYRPIYVRPTSPSGQTEIPDPFDKSDDGAPYYPAYHPKERPSYSSNLKSTEPPKQTATFPPFPGATVKPHSGNIKTKVKPQNEYILGQIDVRGGEDEDEDNEDAENITTTTEPPVQKRKTEKEQQTIVKPSYTHPDKYTESTKPKPEIKKPHVKVKPTPPNGQMVRLRNGASHLDGYLEMKDDNSKWGLVCDQSGQWGIAEATVACRELGFIRGAELSWQAYPIKSESEDLRVAVNGINCTGQETSLSDCKVSHEDLDQCDVGRNAVGLRCFDNLASHCQPGEILYNQHCYKLHEKENPDDPWIKTEEASEVCKRNGGKLVDITTQYENDFLSEWLIKKHPDVTAVATGGIGISVLGRPMWIWEGTNDPMVYERWWSGWSGDQPIPKGSINGPLCIVLRKTFSCVDDDEVQKNVEPTKDEETCSADYFFWDVEDCGELRTSVFICERPMDDIGCVVGNGEGYVGTANTTASGLPCLPWDHPKVVEGLARRGTQQERSSKLVGHNYCRNLGKPDRHPWCFVEGRGNSEYCAIPQCWDFVSGSYSRSSGPWSSCDVNHFECKPGECVKKDWVCDGQKDCTNGRDEENCKVFIQEFTTERNKRMRGKGNEKWPNVSENICAKLCLENKNFKCKSFSYNFKEKDCLLSDTNIGLSGQVVVSRGWVYHERLTDSLPCTLESGFFGCQSGKCINISNVCDGKKNCEDGSDERDCERLGYQIRLVGSKDKHKGRVEVKSKWGVICDDKFDMRDAEVVCRELGFKLGAAEVLKHSEFPVENPLFLVDHLDCLGNETSIRECPFPGWGKHNCGPEEVVGVSCRVPGIECPDGHWQCKRSKECISLAYLCDELKDCDDGTDEDKVMCASPVQIRLAGGPNATSGRLEIRRYDIWGTVCHDDFNVDAANSVCSLLGFNGPSIIKKSAFYGPGKGPIWLDSGLCFVNESTLDECTKHMGFQNNCKHDEDVSLICNQEEFNQKSAAIKPIVASSGDDESKKSEEKLRQVLISECSGKPKTRSRIVQVMQEKVVGGSKVAREAIPWQASVRVRSGSGKSVHWCGAIVISPYHVLTAGHCLRDYNKAAYFIRVGDYDTKVPDPYEEEFSIEHMYMHPEFSKNINLNNDIGLVKVKGEIPLGEGIKPACLAPSVDVYRPGTNCSVSGWGSVSANAAGYARTLRRAYIPILEPSVCRAPFVYGESLSDGMFCAGHLDGGVDSCQGDSGGPLMCQHEGREYLFGITSWGHGCGRANKPGVYTNVAFYTDWIQQKIQSSLS